MRKTIRTGNSLVMFIVLWNGYFGNAEIYPSIHLTPHNPIFSENQNELRVLPNNKVNIICPNPSTVLTTMKDETSKDKLFENLWTVDKIGYESCSAQRGKLMLLCDSPLTLKYSSMVFRRYQPNRKDLEFIPGMEYYFIATSTGTQASLNATSRGHCSSHNMKYKVYVCKDKSDILCSEDKDIRKLSQEKAVQTEFKRNKKLNDTDKLEKSQNQTQIDILCSEDKDIRKLSQEKAVQTEFKKNRKLNDTDKLEKSQNQTQIGNNCRTEKCERTSFPVVALSILLTVVICSFMLNIVLLWRYFRYSRENVTLTDPNRSSEGAGTP